MNPLNVITQNDARPAYLMLRTRGKVRLTRKLRSGTIAGRWHLHGPDIAKYGQWAVLNTGLR